MTCPNCGGSKSWLSSLCRKCGARDPTYRSSVLFLLALLIVAVLFGAILFRGD
jgi:hypothetical protein